MKILLAALTAALVPAAPAAALDDDELLSLVAMPLAVAAVADLADVPTRDLIDVVAALNRARVPPPQFVEVVRYSPVALVETSDPRFVTWVTAEVDRGVTGEALALSLADRLRTYGATEIDVTAPTLVVRERTVLPPVITQRLELDPLSLVAMPLAVAAVADLIDVPTGELMNLVAALNDASVPPPQFIEVLRYAPVVLVDPTLAPQFVTWVRTELDQGTRGHTLALRIADRYRTVGIDEIDVVEPRPVRIVDRDFIPAVVVDRVAEVRGHPHGGPPGQIKKDVGVQTGAEIVHGAHPSGRPAERPARTVPERVTGRDDRDRRDAPPALGRRGDSGRGPAARPASPPGRQKQAGGDRDGGKSGNQGKGKGKGKG